MIKKNVPYNVTKGLWIVLVVFTILNIVGLWIGWCNRETAVDVANKGLVAFGIITGSLNLAVLVGMTFVAFFNQKTEIRSHGWIYGALAVIQLTFVVLLFTLPKKQDNTCPALFTVFLVAILVLCGYFAFKTKPDFSVFGRKNKKETTPIHREDLGSHPDQDFANEVAKQQIQNLQDQPDRKSARDEKTGIVSL